MRWSPLRRLGRIVLADGPVAADATCARLMGLDPRLIFHIAEAGRFLGNIGPDSDHDACRRDAPKRRTVPRAPPISEPPDHGMRSALEHGQKHCGYAARGASVHFCDRGARHWAREFRSE